MKCINVSQIATLMSTRKYLLEILLNTQGRKHSNQKKLQIRSRGENEMK